MQQLLLRRVTDPFDPDPLRVAYEMQCMLADDLSGVQERLQMALPSWNPCGCQPSAFSCQTQHVLLIADS